MAQTHRVPYIDGLRGFAILLVVAYHVYSKSGFAPSAFAAGGFLGVEIFFFVSGFCLMLPYAQWIAARRDCPSLKEYAARRFWKIVPSYYLALAIIATCYPFEAQAGIPRWQDVVLHATFLHSYNATSFASLNSNFWSLAIEVQFYVLFPLIAIAVSARPGRTTAGIVAVGLIYSSFIAKHGTDAEFIWAYSLLSFLPLFSVGGVCAYIFERFVRVADLSESIKRDMTGVSVASLLALLYLFQQVDRVPGGGSTWAWQNGHRLELALILGIFVLSGLASTTSWQAWIANPVLCFYSDISYNVYLWNAVVLSIVSRYYQGDNRWHGLVMFVLTLGSCTIIGWMLTRFYERPLMRNRLAIVRRSIFERNSTTANASRP